MMLRPCGSVTGSVRPKRTSGCARICHHGIAPRFLAAASAKACAYLLFGLYAMTISVRATGVATLALPPFRTVIIGPGVKTGVAIRTDNPREVGADRIANALAAKTLYGAPAIVIDFSGPTVFDAINDAGDYVGSAIAPGIAVSADALFRSTAQLLRVELAPPDPPNVIGKNSINAVRAGLIYGYVSLVEGMVARLKKQLGENARVIATGEQMSLIVNETHVFDAMDEHLTLQGLRLIYELNAK